MPVGRVGIGGLADPTPAFGEADLTEGLVELVVEGAGGGFWQVFGFNQDLALGVCGDVAGFENARI